MRLLVDRAEDLDASRPDKMQPTLDMQRFVLPGAQVC